MDWSSNLCSPEENVLVVGASGFVGRNLVSNLVTKRGKSSEQLRGKVYVLHRNLPLDEERDPGTIVLQGDITDPASLSSAIRSSGCRVIYNLAGIYRWWHPDSEVYEKVNVDGVTNLCNAANETTDSLFASIRIVHVSTVLAYGRVRDASGSVMGLSDETAFDESHTPGDTTSLYAASKQRGDIAFENFFATPRKTLSGILIYLACCIGEDPKLVDPNADVMRLSDMIYERIPATIASDTTFTYVYVQDAAEAIVRAGEKLKVDSPLVKSVESGLATSEVGEEEDHVRAVDPEAKFVAKIFIGNQRLATRSFYSMIAELASAELHREVSAPKVEIPAAFALGWASIASFSRRVVNVVTFGRVRTPPQAMPDVVRTATAGTLLFKCEKSERELGMRYTDIREAFREAVRFVVTHKNAD